MLFPVIMRFVELFFDNLYKTFTIGSVLLHSATVEGYQKSFYRVVKNIDGNH